MNVRVSSEANGRSLLELETLLVAFVKNAAELQTGANGSSRFDNAFAALTRYLQSDTIEIDYTCPVVGVHGAIRSQTI